MQKTRSQRVAGIRRIHGVDPRRVFFAVGQRLRVIFGMNSMSKAHPLSLINSSTGILGGKNEVSWNRTNALYPGACNTGPSGRHATARNQDPAKSAGCAR